VIISTNESADPPSTPIAGRRERRSAH